MVFAATQVQQSAPVRQQPFTAALRTQQRLMRLARPLRASASETEGEAAAAAPDSKDKTLKRSLSNRGFTDNDSAGQTNIFAVEPKTYVQGSAADVTDGQSNTIAAAGIGFVGVSAIAAGLFILSQKGDTGDQYVDGEYLTLSQYKAAFVAELKPAAPKTIAAVAEPAPALADE